MAQDRIERAIRKGFFADLNSDVLAEFQFNPTEIKLPEGSNVNSRTPTGREEPDLLWVSGGPREFRVSLFIDRTNESRGRDVGNVTISDYMLPSDGYFGPGAELVQTANGAISAVRASIDAARGIKPATPTFNMSDYNPSPHINPNDQGFQEDVGVYGEYNKFLKMKRSAGYTNPDMRIAPLLGREVTFLPPPLIVFFFGDLWVEGYVTQLDPTFSVFTKNLVPQRLELEVSMTVLASGILAPLPRSGPSRVVDGVNGPVNTDSNLFL